MKLKIKLNIEEDVKYTIPVFKKSANRWFIEFYYNGTRLRPTFDLNRIKNLKEREKQFIKARAQIENILHEGWDPLEKIEEQYSDNKTFEKAIEFAFNKIKTDLRKTTLSVYTSMFKHISEGTHYEALKNITIKEIKRRDIMDLMENIQKETDISNHVYNRTLKLLKQIFNKLVEYEICDYNVADKIKYKSVEKPKIIIPTDEEVIKIKNYLITNLPNLWNFVFFLFQTGVRPNEICNIKLKYIDLEKRIIHIPKQISKTKVDRVAVIDEPLYIWLQSKDIQSYDKEYFLFGSFKTKETKHHGFTYKDIDISKTPFPRVSITDVWKRLIKNELGLDINMYSFKHLRANKELLINNDLNRAKVLFGHTDLKTTEIYANQKNDIYINQLKSNKIDLNNLQ